MRLTAPELRFLILMAGIAAVLWLFNLHPVCRC